MEDAAASPHRMNELLAKTTRAALAASTVEGPAVFAGLAEQLAGILDVSATMIATEIADRPGFMLARASWLDGRLLQPFDYDLAQTPCRNVIGRQSRFVASGVREEFAPGSLFHARGYDSYAACSLLDGSGQQLGLIAAMDRAPMRDEAVTKAVLQIFAVRASAELERERGEAALRASEASYRAIFEANEDAIFIHDWDSGAILDVSQNASELYGYPREALRRMRVGDLSANEPPYTEAQAAEHIERAKRSAGPLRIEWRARHRDGRLMWHEVTLKRAEIDGRPRVLAFVRDITERKRAEEAVHASEEQYRAIFNASADAMVLWDSTFRRVDINPAYQLLFGVTREEVLAGGGFEHLPVEYSEQRRKLVQRTLAGERCQAELRSVRRNGEPLHVEVRTIPIQHRGQPHVLAIVRDITARKEHEEELRRSEGRLRATVEAALDAVIGMDSAGNIVEFNAAAEHCFGHRREDALGQPLAELIIPPRHRQRHLAGMAHYLHTGEGPFLGRRVIVEAMRADGSEFPAELAIGVAPSRDGPIFIGYLRDITERKTVDDALRASEEQYRAIFNASADALVLRDADFRIVDVNATYEAMTGLSRAEVLGADRVLANPPEVNESIKPLHQKALAGEPIVFETQLIHRDGARYDLELRGVPILHRAAPHVLYMGRDITARRRAEDQQRELQAQLRQVQKMEAIGQLTGGIAHDFNNILAAIMGYVGLALERPAISADGKLADYLEQAQISGRRARDLIQQMLAFSRGRRGERRVMSLAPLLNESLQLLRATLPSSIAFEVEAAEDTAMANVDSVQLQQVILNLGINARDAIGGAGRIRVGVSAGKPAAHVCASCGHSFRGVYHRLWVADSGPGIVPELRSRIFEPFFSTKAPGAGTGMGLATVHRIVHDHRGHLLLDADGGARFEVLVPAEGAAGAAARPVGDVPAATARRVLLRGRVLLVDDEESVLGFMRELLQSWGLDVIAMRQAPAARDLLLAGSTAIDLLLTDQTMPDLGGVDLAYAAHSTRPDLPVLLYSGHADLIDVEALKQAGVRRVLRKPLEPAELHAAIEECLGAPAEIRSAGAFGRSEAKRG